MTHILGIGGLGYKDSAACILSDGRLVAAAAEERFSGIKHEGGFPHRAVAFCLERAGISAKQLSGVAVANNPWLPMREKVLGWYGESFFKSRTANVYNVFKDESHRLVEYLRRIEELRAKKKGPGAFWNALWLTARQAHGDDSVSDAEIEGAFATLTS